MEATPGSIRRTLSQQAVVGLLLGSGLAVGGFVRVYLTNGNLANAVSVGLSHLRRAAAALYDSEASAGVCEESALLLQVAISASLFMIVMTSVLAGAGLPFGLARLGVDPANAGTSIQVTLCCRGLLHLLTVYTTYYNAKLC